MSDLIDRQKAIDAIEDYAKAANDNYEYDKEFGLLQAREILIKAPQYEQDCGDAISRERALKEMAFSDAIRTDDNILYVPLKDVKRHLQNLSSVQPEQVIPHRNYKNLLDYWCECGCYLGKKGEKNYCPDCGKRINWNGKTD